MRANEHNEDQDQDQDKNTHGMATIGDPSARQSAQALHLRGVFEIMVKTGLRITILIPFTTQVSLQAKRLIVPKVKL